MASVLPAQVQPDWRRVGNGLIEAGLPSAATGPVDRVWFGGGGRLHARTADQRVFATGDYETWERAAEAPGSEQVLPGRMPEAGARLRWTPGSRILYAVGRRAWRSDDGGSTWRNLTEHRGRSLLGPGIADLAVSPRDSEEIVAASSTGVWRSLDGGLSWTGVNEGLPNLPVRRILRLPGNGAAARIEIGGPAAAVEAEWSAGGWVPQANGIAVVERQLRDAIGAAVESPVRAVAVAGDTIYAGGGEGRLWVSSDRGQNWRPFQLAASGGVNALWVDRANPRLALAALDAVDGAGVRIARTINGGLFWDDLTAGLGGNAYGVAADPATGAVYAAAEGGLFLTYGDLIAAGPATQWTLVRGRLPEGAARDVRLDEGGNQVWVAVEGHGLFAALAPHRFRDPRVVNAADFSSRAAAPGTLLSVLGGRISRAQAGSMELPVLGATDSESQIQVPFEASGESLRLALYDGSAAPREFPLALRPVAPAIFADRDGVPMVLDAERGLLLESGMPARAGSRIQILATGLGRVVPAWPTGLAAPLDNPPEVVAPVRVFLDRAPVEVIRATLAPGYVGFYLVEVQLPEVVNAGPAELFLESGGQSSGRVSLLLAQ